ncbi:MAG: sigma-54 dependent transcriptional regulator [Paraprevotella sp.]|nr:sigma-54 dependent transcriptional regulator [Paraprevotella sp.]
MAAILIVEDDLTFATMLKTWLGKQGFQIDTAGDLPKARKLLDSKTYDIILSDLRLPEGDGLSLLDWMQHRDMRTPFMVMTGYADVQNAVNAMKQGACDYIAKPVQPAMLLDKIQDALSSKTETTSSAAPTVHSTDTTENNDYNSHFLEGKSEATRQLYNYVALVAPTPMSVLINGASGTGKEYVAHRIHQLSKRADKPFVAIDCGAMLKELAASEFFGHIKGSFTGAVTDKTGAFVEANGGTLVLDEVGNLSYDVQVQLLRAIQERKIRPVGSNQEIEVDVRLICATNENLQQAIARGEFREDLYHRLNEFTLHMPALKDRGEDILLFANFFLDQANKELERNLIGFDAAASEALLNYSWPGNLRELKNTIKRATLLAQGELIRKADLVSEFSETPSETDATESVAHPLHDKETEKERILQALQSANHNKALAARLLGIDRKTLYNKIRLYDIPQ